MSTWTFKRAALGLAALTLLTGCLGEGTDGGIAPKSANILTPTGQSNALAQAAIVPKRVIAKGPAGYCVDKRSLQARSTGGFALLAPCAALGAKATGTEEPVLMTIQAQLKGLQAGPTNADGLAEAFAELEPVYRETGDGLSLVQLAKGGDEIIPNGEPKHWRAALSFNGYLIGLAVYSEKGGPAAQKRGKALLVAFAEGVLAHSPIKSAEPQAAAETTKNAKLPKLFSNILQ